MTTGHRYGVWSGNPIGQAEDETRCVFEVSRNWHSNQCERKRGHGLDGLYCKVHARRYPAASDATAPLGHTEKEWGNA